MKIVLLEPGAADLVRFLKVKFCSSDNSRPHGFVVLVWMQHQIVFTCSNEFKYVQMCSFVFKLVQNLFKCYYMCSNVFKCVHLCSNLFKTCSNVFKCDQTCLKLVQMCWNVFKLVQNLFKCVHFIYVQTCSKLFLMWCTKGITQYSCKTDVPWWRDVHMNTFIHSPVSPLLVDIASYYQYTRQ